jgi:hypothetical protein
MRIKRRKRLSEEEKNDRCPCPAMQIKIGCSLPSYNLKETSKSLFAYLFTHTREPQEEPSYRTD